MKEKKETDLYNKAKEKNYIEYYEDYIQTYPNGKYSTIVNDILQRSYIFLGDKKYKAKSYNDAISYYQKYLNRYAQGNQSTYARKQIEKCERKIKMSNIADKWYLNYHFDDSLA